MKTISIAITTALFSCLAINGLRADHHQTQALRSPKLESIQVSQICTCDQVADSRDLARERGQLVTGKMYHLRPPTVVASTGQNDPNLTKGLVHMGKHQRDAVTKDRFELAPVRSN